MILDNIDLLPYNTFKIKAMARYFAVVRSVSEAREQFGSSLFRHNPFLILGGGSNILFTKDFEGLVIKNEIKGIEIVDESPLQITLKAGAGESWHDLVMYCVARDYGGIENLSLIPGTVGAAPMQNIGAYGVEIREVIHNVEGIEIKSGDIRLFDKKDCQFAYRESIFKHGLKNKFFISSITLSLTKKDHHFNISYGTIREELSKQNGEKNPSVKKISDAVIAIRKSKLPDPEVIGNAGSFFKNPSIDQSLFNKIQEKYPSIPSFQGENGMIKVPAAWLIEQSGWKGKTFDNIGVHKHQALVLVNYGGGEGEKIRELSMNIQSSVKEKFNITLQPEVNII